MNHRIERLFIQSAGKKVFIQIEYPKGKLPRPAIVIAHGLRSYYTGFLSMFSRVLCDAGYITVKFHFLGTGKSDGNFEDKTTKAMLQNYRDVVAFLARKKEIRGIGIVGRSNAGCLAVVSGPDPVIKAYVLLAPDAFYSHGMKIFVRKGEVRNGFVYHTSFKRKHTNGPGRLPMTFIEEIEKFDKPLLANIPKMKNVAIFQSEKDEATLVADGHFDYYKKHLPKGSEFHYYKGGNHSFKGFKRIVIADALKWFKKKLPVK